MTTTRPRLAALAGAALVTVIAAGCTQSAPEPGPSATNVKPPTSTTTSTSTPPSTSGTTSSTSTPPATSSPPTPAEAKAYAAAEAVYRKWVVNFGQAAAAGFDPKKLDSRLATPALIDVLTKQFKTFPQKQKGGAGKYVQTIRWMKPYRYLENQTVTFQICAVTDLRFLLNDKDVTITSTGAPAPVETLPQLRFVSLETIDNGKSWRSSTILYPNNAKKASC